MENLNTNAKINVENGCRLEYAKEAIYGNTVKMTHMKNKSNTSLCSWIYEELKNTYGLDLSYLDNKFSFDDKTFTIELVIDTINMSESGETDRVNLITFKMSGKLSIDYTSTSRVDILINGINIENIIRSIADRTSNVITITTVSFKEE